MWILTALSFVKGNARLFAYGIAITACIAIGWHFRGIWDESALERAINAQIEQCNVEKRAAYEASADFQNKIRILNNRVGDLKRLRVTQCVNVTTGKPNGASGGPVNGGTDAVPATEFLDYSQLAEKYRLQVIGLQSWASKYCK